MIYLSREKRTKMHSNWISWVICHGKSIEHWTSRRKLKWFNAVFQIVDIKWRRTAVKNNVYIFKKKKHGFLLIKENILLPWLFCDFWRRKSGTNSALILSSVSEAVIAYFPDLKFWNCSEDREVGKSAWIFKTPANVWVLSLQRF